MIVTLIFFIFFYFLHFLAVRNRISVIDTLYMKEVGRQLPVPRCIVVTAMRPDM